MPSFERYVNIHYVEPMVSSRSDRSEGLGVGGVRHREQNRSIKGGRHLCLLVNLGRLKKQSAHDNMGYTQTSKTNKLAPIVIGTIFIRCGFSYLIRLIC